MPELNLESRLFDIPHFNPAHYTTSAPLPIFSTEIMKRYRVIPLAERDNMLHLGIADPSDQATLDAIAFHYGGQIYPVLMFETQIKQFIDNINEPALSNHYFKLPDLKDTSNTHLIQENSSSYDEPLIKFVDSILQDALLKSASDIHIEPYEKHCRIRYRQDGMLYTITEIPSNLAERLITRLKVISKLDIAERRLPQDGHFQIANNKNKSIDVRINTCPTLFGEKVVLRVLDDSKLSLDINVLGMTESQQTLFISAISKPQGLILVTGPTGSGKTVSLYSALHYLNTPEKNISTVEDPVEIQLAGINQVNINPKIGLHFTQVLRTFLRQDPDIIMIGEIRDPETAKIAIQAAQTGHLVLSTLHTSSAYETLIRLKAMGIAEYDLLNSLSLVIAQRLARKLCDLCKVPEIILPRKDLGIDEEISAFRALGCQHCLQGYQGRVGIYEILAPEDFNHYSSLETHLQPALKPNLKPHLKQSALNKILNGTTSLAEILRIL